MVRRGRFKSAVNSPVHLTFKRLRVTPDLSPNRSVKEVEENSGRTAKTARLDSYWLRTSSRMRKRPQVLWVRLLGKHMGCHLMRLCRSRTTLVSGGSPNMRRA
jgi:hypothetical protein